MKQDQFLTFLVNFCKKNIAKLFMIFGVFLAFTPTILHAQYVYGSGAKLSKISPLMSAVATNDIEGVEFFSKAGSDVLDQRNIGGATALHIAARNQNFEIVQTLIKSGANVNISDNDGWTALMRAASVGNSQIVSELLISGADANKKNSVKETAIIHSANSSCSGCMESVLNYINYEKINKNYLDDQLEEAFIIANNKSDAETKKILNKFRTKISAGDYPKLFNKDKYGLDLMKLKRAKDNSKKYSLGSKKGQKIKKTPKKPEESDKKNNFLLKKHKKPLKKMKFKRKKVNQGDLEAIKQPEADLKKEIEKEIKVIRRKNYLFIKGKRWSDNKELMKKYRKFTTKSEPKKQKTIKFIRKNVIEDVKKEPKIKIEEKPRKKIIYKRNNFNKPKIATEIDNELRLPNNDDIAIEEEITEEIIPEKTIKEDNQGKNFSFYKMKQKEEVKAQENKLPSFFKLKEQAKADNEVEELSKSDDDVIYFMQEE